MNCEKLNPEDKGEIIREIGDHLFYLIDDYIYDLDEEFKKVNRDKTISKGCKRLFEYMVEYTKSVLGFNSYTFKLKSDELAYINLKISEINGVELSDRQISNCLKKLIDSGYIIKDEFRKYPVRRYAVSVVGKKSYNRITPRIRATKRRTGNSKVPVEKEVDSLPLSCDDFLLNKRTGISNPHSIYIKTEDTFNNISLNKQGGNFLCKKSDIVKRSREIYGFNKFTPKFKNTKKYSYWGSNTYSKNKRAILEANMKKKYEQRRQGSDYMLREFNRVLSVNIEMSESLLKKLCLFQTEYGTLQDWDNYLKSKIGGRISYPLGFLNYILGFDVLDEYFDNEKSRGEVKKFSGSYSDRPFRKANRYNTPPVEDRSHDGEYEYYRPYDDSHCVNSGSVRHYDVCSKPSLDFSDLPFEDTVVECAQDFRKEIKDLLTGSIKDIKNLQVGGNKMEAQREEANPVIRDFLNFVNCKNKIAYDVIIPHCKRAFNLDIGVTSSNKIHFYFIDGKGKIKKNSHGENFNSSDFHDDFGQTYYNTWIKPIEQLVSDFNSYHAQNLFNEPTAVKTGNLSMFRMNVEDEIEDAYKALAKKYYSDDLERCKKTMESINLKIIKTPLAIRLVATNPDGSLKKDRLGTVIGFEDMLAYVDQQDHVQEKKDKIKRAIKSYFQLVQEFDTELRQRRNEF